MRRIYTKEMRCFCCREVIEVYSKKNRQRTVKSWLSMCRKCYKASMSDVENRIEKLEKIVLSKSDINQ